MDSNLPKTIILLSGKRKSGKDYISEILKKRLGDKCELIRISEPIKSHFANNFKLDLKSLMGTSKYKEKYRLEMILWSEDVRRKDYGYFCSIACKQAKLAEVWIVSDIRRKTDIKWFTENFKEIVKTVRIDAVDAVRKSRGWTFCSGIDDAESECNLDDWNEWDLHVSNNENDSEKCIEDILLLIN